MPLTHKHSVYHYKTDVCKDPSDYKSSCPEVFCKKGFLRNFGKFTGKRFIKKETLAHVFYCKFCEIFKNTFFIEHL